MCSFIITLQIALFDLYKEDPGYRLREYKTLLQEKYNLNVSLDKIHRKFYNDWDITDKEARRVSIAKYSASYVSQLAFACCALIVYLFLLLFQQHKKIRCLSS